MILSVSTRTDIPAYYGDWFMYWLELGCFYIKNPYNKKLVTKLEINSNNVDCIVFWTKNGVDFIKYLPTISQLNYKFYFQYTITSYTKEIESLKNTKKEIVNNFIEISNMIGKDKIILRYDPIIMSEKYNLEYHIKSFKRLLLLLHNYTDKVVVSFLDIYDKVAFKIKDLNIRKPNNEEIDYLLYEFSKICKSYNIILSTCAEEIDLSKYQIEKNSCIDATLIEKITNKKLNKYLKANKRKQCLCLKHIDIGEYNTCFANCRYCYARGKTLKVEHKTNYEFINGKLKDEKVVVKNKDEVVFENNQTFFNFNNKV